MLNIPSYTSNVARVIGIDPGTNTLGLSIIAFNVETLQIVSTTATTYTGTKLGEHAFFDEQFGQRFTRVYFHKQNLLDILYETQPICVIAESPFFNSKFPQAYGALMEIMLAIRQVLFEYDRWMTLELIPPSNVKQAVKAKNFIGKNSVKEGVLNLQDLNYLGNPPIHALDEHSIDAIAVAYSKILDYRGHHA